jgi:hypothetical protein
MNNKLAHLGFAAGPRMEPLMVYLHGTSGKGKSGLTVPFFIELARHDPDFDPKDWTKLIYMRCAETEYWDGARNDQPFLCYDDFGQQRDSAANPNPELFEIIRLANIVPYPAHMASLEEKGKTFMHPRCVLLTSNSRVPRIESLTFPDAFHRRMDIVAEVDIKPEFSKVITTQNGDIRMLDVSKCKSQFDPRCYVFHVDGENDMDWREFMAHVTFKYEARMVRGEKLLNELNNYTAHSLDSIYESMADGTFDDMVSETMKNWTPQADTDPYIPRTGRTATELHDECVKRTEEWYEGKIAPTDELYQMMKSLQREVARALYDNPQCEHYKTVHAKWYVEFDLILQNVAAAQAAFMDGIDTTTIVGQLFVLYLRNQLPAQLYPDKCVNADKNILQYFVSQRDALMNPIIFPSVASKNMMDVLEKDPNIPEYLKKYLANSAALGGSYGAFSNPMLFVYKLWSTNWNQKTLPPRFDINACARAIKGLYYGKYFSAAKIDTTCGDLVEVYAKRGAACFMDTYKPVNRRAAIRLSRVFNQVTSQCSTSGCTKDLIECFRDGIVTALSSGIVIPHDIMELNQTPVFLIEEEKELIKCFKGDTFWQKFRFAWFDLSFKFTEWFGNYPKIMFCITLLGSVVMWQLVMALINICMIAVNLLGEQLGLVKTPKIWTTDNVPENLFLKTSLPYLFTAKIEKDDCPYCQAGSFFGEGIQEDLNAKISHIFTNVGFVNRFDYYAMRRLIFDAKNQPKSLFEFYRKRIDDVNGPGCFHVMLHGGLDSHPQFASKTFNDKEVQAFEKKYNELWKEECERNNYSYDQTFSKMVGESKVKHRGSFMRESMNMKEARAKNVHIESQTTESMSLKDARHPNIRIESFTQKDARVPMMKIENYEPEGNPSASAYFQAMKEVYEDAKVSPEGLLDNNAWEVISKKVFRNQFILTTQSGSEIAKGVFIRGTCALIYKHWRANCPVDAVQCRFLDNRPYFNVNLSTVKFYDFETTRGENEDLLMMVFPNSCPQYPDILNHFVTAQDLPRVEGRQAQLCGIIDVCDGNFVSYNLQNLVLECEDASYTDGSTTYKCRKGYSYRGETKAGDCGSVLVLKDTAFDKKIVGIHVAGRPGHGYAMCVYKEKLEHVLAKVGWEAQCFPPLEMINCVESQVPEGAFFAIGKLPFPAGSVGTSTLERTMISGCCMESEKKPAYLKPFVMHRDGEEVFWNPLMEGLKKCGKVLTPISEETMGIVVEDVARVYVNATPYSRKRCIYNVREAIFGTEGDEYFSSLTTSTSPGFPWGLTKESRMGGKKTWIDLDQQIISEDLIYHVEKRIEFALAGRRYPTLWIDLLKDETRPIEKADAGKTRVFSGSPLDFTIACRMYFGAFVAAQAEGRIENESLVGTNCYAEDWNLVAKTLLQHGDRIVAGDYSNWDGSVSAQLLYASLAVINKWYGKDEQGNKVRTILMADIANSLHVINNDVYMWTHSMPSGVYLTATVNTIIGQMLMRIFYLKSVPKQLATMSDFERNVKIAIYGDDNVVNVSEKIRPYFNQHTITTAASDLGMTYTDEQKSADQSVIPLTRTLKEVTLLKRHFTYSQQEGRWIGPLQIRTVLDIPNWYRKTMPEKVVLPLIVECVLRELSLHPREVFYKHRNEIFDALVDNYMRVPAMGDYDSLRFSMLNGYKSYFGQSD